MTTCIICNIQTLEHTGAGVTVHDVCMNNYHAYVKELIKVKGCSMCGNTKRKLIENTCTKCLNSIY